jgi:hypothetical protein
VYQVMKDEMLEKLIRFNFMNAEIGRKVLNKLTNVWADVSFIRHTDYHQHRCMSHYILLVDMYITC